jgi:hypothetical protein
MVETLETATSWPGSASSTSPSAGALHRDPRGTRHPAPGAVPHLPPLPHRRLAVLHVGRPPASPARSSTSGTRRSGPPATRSSPTAARSPTTTRSAPTTARGCRRGRRPGRRGAAGRQGAPRPHRGSATRASCSRSAPTTRCPATARPRSPHEPRVPTLATATSPRGPRPAGARAVQPVAGRRPRGAGGCRRRRRLEQHGLPHRVVTTASLEHALEEAARACAAARWSRRSAATGSPAGSPTSSPPRRHPRGAARGPRQRLRACGRPARATPRTPPSVLATGRGASRRPRRGDRRRRPPTRRFLGILSVGIDSEVQRIAETTRLPLGRHTYAYGASPRCAGWRSLPFALEVDGDAVRMSGFTVAVANSGVYGGGCGWPRRPARRRPPRRGADLRHSGCGCCGA